VGVAHALFLANALCSKESCSPSSQYKNSATTQQKKANEIRIPYRRVHITCHLGKAGRSVGAREKEGCSMLAAIFCICSALKLRSLPILRATFARATRVLCSRQPGAPRRAPCAPPPCCRSCARWLSRARISCLRITITSQWSFPYAYSRAVVLYSFLARVCTLACTIASTFACPLLADNLRVPSACRKV
jgi:hypothetical protein